MTTARRLVVAALVLSAAVRLRPADAAPTEQALSDTACFLLFIAGAPGAVAADNGQEANRVPLESGCNYASCWMRQDVDGLSECAYGRGATLTINALPSAKLARRAVKAVIASGYQRIKVRAANLAGERTLENGLVVVLAVGKATALLALGPVSDIDAAPTWQGLDTEILNEARTVAQRLRRKGCTGNYQRCAAAGA